MFMYQNRMKLGERRTFIICCSIAGFISTWAISGILVAVEDYYDISGMFAGIALWAVLFITLATFEIRPRIHYFIKFATIKNVRIIATHFLVTYLYPITIIIIINIGGVFCVPSGIRRRYRTGDREMYKLIFCKNTHRFPIMSHRLLCIPNYTNQDRVCISKIMRRSKRRKSQQ